MTITAKYPGTCGQCGRPIMVGEQIEWTRGSRPRHTTCPTAVAPERPIIALVAGGAQIPRGTNRRAACCDRCGEHLPAGTGSLVRCWADTGCLEHHDEDGWHVYCRDEAACGTRVTERRAAAKVESARRAAEGAAKRAAEQAQEAAYAAALQACTAGLVRIPAESHEIDAREGAEIARCDSGFFRTSLSARRGGGYYETATGHDDWREYVYITADEVLARGRALLADCGEEKVRTYLAQYDGCHGAEVYRAAAWAAGMDLVVVVDGGGQ